MSRDTYVRIGQAAQLAGVSVDTFRRWEADGKLSATRSPGGQRSYRLADIENLRDDNDDDDVHEAEPEAVNVALRPAPLPVPAWKAREANAAADLSVTKLRIERQKEVRRYRVAEQLRLDTHRAETERHAEDVRRHTQQSAEQQRKQAALDGCLRLVRLRTTFEPSKVRAEVERFLADNANVDTSIPWIEAEVNVILEGHAERERQARHEQLQSAAQAVADAINRNTLLRRAESVAKRITSDREQWDADVAKEAVEDVCERVAELLDPTWSPKRIEQEVVNMLAEWE